MKCFYEYNEYKIIHLHFININFILGRKNLSLCIQTSFSNFLDHSFKIRPINYRHIFTRGFWIAIYSDIDSKFKDFNIWLKTNYLQIKPRLLYNIYQYCVCLVCLGLLIVAFVAQCQRKTQTETDAFQRVSSGLHV